MESQEMQEVGLFQKNDSKLSNSSKRPPALSVQRHSDNHKWKECKIIGKNISIRSYAAACNHHDLFYLYGGYQILHGSLNEFLRISLRETGELFAWETVPCSGTGPGARSKHALVGTRSHVYLIGGLNHSGSATNEMWAYSPVEEKWEKLTPEGARLPAIESFGAVVVSSGEEQRIVIAGGFNDETASPSNVVYQYAPASNKLSILFEGGQAGKEVPAPRTGCAVASDNEAIYIFGGKDEAERMQDLWRFSLSDYKFTLLPTEGEVPAVRNGHTMNHLDGKLYVFGGIHDITWELDDLHIYDLKTQRWTTLEQDSPRKVERKSSPSREEDKAAEGKKKKGNWYDTHTANVGNNNKSTAGSPGRNYSITYHEDGSGSPGKMLDEQRRKVFQQKKAEMLSNFDVSKGEKEKLVSLQTSSQAMKNSLDVIGDPDPKHPRSDRLTEFGKESVSKFLSPLENCSNLVVGKKPCARDGHCAVMMGHQLVIFGGDRHQMSFNDIYKLDIAKAAKELPPH